ncbi:MAG: CAP domain-containing protein [Actinomycetota bacterium]
MPTDRAPRPRRTTVVTLVAVLVTVLWAPAAEAGPAEWFDGFRHRMLQVAAQVSTRWQAQIDAARMAEEQARALQEAHAGQGDVVSQAQRRAALAARADDELLERQYLMGPSVPPETFLSADELAMLGLLNAERARSGLRPIIPDPVLSQWARRHSADMAARQRLEHTPRLSSAAPRSLRWRRLSENIGVGWTPASLHRTLMTSQAHKAAILGRYDRVGIGIVASPGRLWATQEFMRSR